MAMAFSKAGAVNPNETFLSQAEDTTYGSVLKERMVFTIYVHRGGPKASFHDKIVVSSSKYGFVTLELSLDMERSQIVPMCQQFHGQVSELEWKKEVECTFEDLADVAIKILRSMGPYSLTRNNCQNFCNYFLKEMEAPQYMTTQKQVVIASAIGIGIVGATVLVWNLLTGGSSSSKSKK